MDAIASRLSLYNFLNFMVLTSLIFRFLYAWVFQDRVGMITRTLLRTPQALGEFLVLFFSLLVLVSFLLSIAFGPRVQ